MNLNVPWIDALVAIPFMGGLWCWRQREPRHARSIAILCSAVTLLLALASYVDAAISERDARHSFSLLLAYCGGRDSWTVNQVNAPLIPLTALIYFVTILATMKTKIGRFSFPRTLVSESLTLVVMSCQSAWWLVILLIATAFPVWRELGQRQQCRRVFVLHLGASAGLMFMGQFISHFFRGSTATSIASLCLTLGILVRSGIFPAHCWTTDLFTRCGFGTAILFAAPLTAAYAFVRLVLPIAPDWVLRLALCLALITTIYSAAMATMEHDARRWFCYLYLSSSSLTIVGISLATPLGVAAAMCVWLSVALSLTGLGLVLRCVESRSGRISLSQFHGLFQSMPAFAGFFLLTSLALIGFPGTIGFFSLELLVDSAVEYHAVAGVIVVLAAALNSITVLATFFRVFAGPQHSSSIPIAIRPPERAAVLVLTFLILGGGLFPQPGVASRFRAALDLQSIRESKANAYLVQTSARNTLSTHER